MDKKAFDLFALSDGFSYLCHQEIIPKYYIQI